MLSPTTWSLGRRVRALSAAVAAVLGLLALGAVFAATANRSDNRHVSTQLTPALINKERLYTGLLRQQSSVRTFLLSGREDDLRSYHEATEVERDVLATTRRLLEREPSLRARLDRVAAATERYRTEITEPLIATARSSGPSAALAMPDDHARSTYRAAADEINSFGERLAARRIHVLRRVASSSNTLIALLVGAALTIVAAGFTLASLLRRVVTRPVTDLAAEVRRVARGDYDHEISGSGVPELANLARDVNAMRHQIANDLATVRLARKQVELINERLAEANRQLESQAEELTRSNRDLEQFAYVASHDLQEPLRKVASFCQLLQRRYLGRLDERADQYIGFAVDGAQRMQRLINDLLAFSRIGRITSGFAEIDLNQLMDEVATQLDGAREEAGAEITWDRLPVVRGEEALLQALLTNLVSNSLKFRRTDVPSRVHLAARRVNDEWEISCRDNGIGIAPEFAEKVFVIFQRLHSKETYAGTGIGLAIAKKIVEYHGGRVWIDPEYRDGTLIRLTLPVTDAARLTTANEPTAEPMAEPATESTAQPTAEPATQLAAVTAPAPAIEEPSHGRSDR